MTITQATRLSGAKPFAIPQPRFQIGDMVMWDKNYIHYEANKKHYIKKYRKYMLGEDSKILKSLKRQGFTSSTTEPNTKKIDEVCSTLSNAETMYIIGITARGMHARDCTDYHESYIPGITGAASGVYYEYQICVRWDNRALFTSIPVVSENDLIKVTTPE